MCGTDYNKNIFRVGPAKAFSYISEYKTIEAVAEKTGLDISVLNHIRVRELFKEYKKSEIKVPYCGKPDINEFELFVTKKNLNVSVKAVKKAFSENENIVIEQ